MRYLSTLIFCTLLFLRLDASSYDFKEVWAYVMQGEEKWIQPERPITDIAYFSALIDETGRLPKHPNIELIKGNCPPKARVHCVISSPYNTSLIYFLLLRDTETRQNLINDIVHIASFYDGVQVDLECIRDVDGKAYVSFLQDIKKSLPKEKILSVALPARQEEESDGYPYKEIGEVADKVLIMAYDEHWRTGPPGNIASIEWCEKIANFSKQKIPQDKLIMGIPLYGRIWQKQDVARALKHFQTLDLIKEINPSIKRESDGTPFFEFEKTVSAVAFYEDSLSLENKLVSYTNLEVSSIGFWRLSQEPAPLWEHINVAN